MKPSNELFELIKSLTKSEKRFFKMVSSLQSGDKNYVRIFDTIDVCDEYDEDAVKAEFKGEKFVKHFPSEKNHLYKLLLKSLRQFHADNSISGILRQEIKNIEILFKKALYKECGKFVQRAKKLAAEHEKFYYLFELINWEKQLLEEEFETGDFDKDLDALISEELSCIEKLRNLAEYQMIYSRVNYVIRRGGYARNEDERKIIREIENYHLIKGKNTAISSRASSICYYIKGVCAAFNRDHAEALVNFNKVKSIINNNPQLKPDLASRYIRTLLLILNSHIEENRFSDAREILNEIEYLKDEPGFDSTNIQLKLVSGDYRKAIAIVPEITRMLARQMDKMNKEQVVEFYYNLAGTYFMAGDYKESLQWLNKVLNDNEKQLRRDIYNYSRVVNLVIHYELGNFDLLEYVIKSTARYLSRDDKDLQAEKVLVNHLRKLIKLDSEKKKLDAFRQMKKELEELFVDKKEEVFLNYFDVMAWIESKIAGLPLQEVLKRRFHHEKHQAG
jgi:tetratricopeptide (TPR) repeat protein